MARTVVGAIALVTFVLLCVGAYGLLTADPAQPPPAGPEFTDTAATPLPTADEFERLAKTDPVAMYEKCLAHYQRTAKGLSATLVKRERVGGEPLPEQPEVIQLAVRGDVPDPATGKHDIEVAMRWVSGAKTAFGFEVRATVYSEKPKPEGTGKELVTYRPNAILKTNALPPADPKAQAQSRYSIRDAGIYRGMLRTYDAWKQRKAAGTLKTEYVEKRAVAEVGGRVCHLIDRFAVAPEVDAFELGGEPSADPAVIARDGFTRVRVMIDAETWMQVGSELYRPDGTLLASYYFRNVDTNPSFGPDTFTVAGLKAKK